MQTSPVLSLSRSCPSFSSYSSSNLAEIAARVVQELRMESSESDSAILDYWDTEYYGEEDYKNRAEDENRGETEEAIIEDEEEEEEEEKEFEFAVVCRETDSSPISADEIFYNGQIKPIYPIFDTSLLTNQNQTPQLQVEAQNLHTSNTNISQNKATNTTKRRPPLKKLLSEEREMPTSSYSSSEADDHLEGAEPGTFCVWTPRKTEETEEDQGRCKKSHSTGSSSSSKRWKFRDLLYNRSSSDGKDRFLFLKSEKEREKDLEGKKAKDKDKEQNFMKMKNKADVKNPRSFLPYRQELVGIFSNVNGLNRNLHPF